MGLANYAEQVANLQRLEAASHSLNEGRGLLKQANELARAGWGANIDSIRFQDLLTGLSSNGVGKLQHDLRCFVRDAATILDRMNGLEQLGLVAGLVPFPFVSYARLPVEQPLIRVDTRLLDQAAQCLMSAGVHINQAKDSVRMADGRLDPMLRVQQDLGKRLGSLHQGHEQLLSQTKGAAHYLRQAIALYERTEQRIAQRADALKTIGGPFAKLVTPGIISEVVTMGIPGGTKFFSAFGAE